MSDDVRKNFPKLLKYYLMLNGKTQKDLVDYLGVSQSAVSNWTTGIRLPDMEIVAKIAKFLHIEIQDLIQEDKLNKNYYLNDDAKQIAQFVSNNPEYKPLVNASFKVKKEDIPFVKEMIDRVSNTNNKPYDSVPDTPEELERLYPPVDIKEWKKKNKSNK